MKILKIFNKPKKPKSTPSERKQNVIDLKIEFDNAVKLANDIRQSLDTNPEKWRLTGKFDNLYNRGNSYLGSLYFAINKVDFWSGRVEIEEDQDLRAFIIEELTTYYDKVSACEFIWAALDLIDKHVNLGSSLYGIHVESLIKKMSSGARKSELATILGVETSFTPYNQDIFWFQSGFKPGTFETRFTYSHLMQEANRLAHDHPFVEGCTNTIEDVANRYPVIGGIRSVDILNWPAYFRRFV